MSGELNSWEQKKRFHAMCRDLSQQVEYAGRMWDEEDWKRLVIGAAHGQDIVPNPFNYGFVVMNKKRVRDMEMPPMSDLITQMLAFGNERRVNWTDPEGRAMMAEAESRN